MKTLILACNTGEGHNSTATAIQQVFERQGVACDRADSLVFLSKFVSTVVCAGHDQVYRHIPRAFGAGYRAAERNPRVFRKRSLIYHLLTHGAGKLYRFILEGEYDSVICTHAFSAMMATGMREKYELPGVRFSFVATDYTCSPIVNECNMETFFIPDESLADEFAGKGVARERLYAAGLPVRTPFLTRTERQEAKARCGIDPSRKHLLMMCGSMGCGPMEELATLLAARIDGGAVVTVICGTNKNLYKKLHRRFAASECIRVQGYVNNVPELMDSADLYLTKPGGISVTEATAKRLPMVLVNAVAGCEEYNLRYCIERGMACTAATPSEIADVCVALLSDEGKLEQMRENLERYSHDDAAERMFAYLVSKDGDGVQSPTTSAAVGGES